jgi:hypothetical protein
VDRVVALLDQAAERYGDDPTAWPTVEAPKQLRLPARKGSGERRGLTGQVRCAGCGQWIRKRPELGDWDEEERAYAGEEFEEHYCEADFWGYDLTPGEAEREAWLAQEAREVS